MPKALFSGLLFVVLLCVPAASAVPPDPAFTTQAQSYILAKKNEFLQQIVATGNVPTPVQEGEAWCRAVMWWKMSNPDGEQRLTLDGLTDLRRMEYVCAQRMRRAAPLPSERQTPPQTVFTPRADDDGVDNIEEPLDDNDGTRQALEDFMRWHPDEFDDAPTEEEYVGRRLLWWWVLGPGKELQEAANQSGGSGVRNVNGTGATDAERALAAAEAAEEERARQQWREQHPNAPEPEPTQSAENELPPGATRDPYRGRIVLPPPPGFVVDPYRGGLIPDPNAGSVDPLDIERWQRARQPIELGANDDVGSGARRREQALGAVANAIGGALGAGGGAGRGPELARCRVRERDMALFERGDVQIGVLAERHGDDVVLYAEVVRSPDSGTFQAAVLQNQHGQMLAPDDADLCELYGRWRLSVSWTRTTFRDGSQVGQDRGGWTQAGPFGLPGLDGEAGSTGLWSRFGFSNASHGAKRVAVTFNLPRARLVQDGAVLLLHITRPGQDPVTSEPFALMIEESPTGFSFTPCP